jgi:diguanylate cyclase (GGDEF)-like protein
MCFTALLDGAASRGVRWRVLDTARDDLTLGRDSHTRLKKRGILLATGGLLLALAVALGLRMTGFTRASYAAWATVLALTLAVQGLLWLVPARGWDARLSFDPHYVYVPVLAVIGLFNTYVWLVPEARHLILLLWFVAVLFMVGRAGFRALVVLGSVMTSGYLLVLHWRSRTDPGLWLPFEWLSAVLFLATNVYAGLVLERIRRKLGHARALRWKLAELAATDPLTGLPNRRQCEAVLQAEIARVAGCGGRCALALIDVDFFKSYNDRLGHLAGDGLLRELGSLLREQLRATDTLGRYGGDELAAILPQTAKEDARRMMERLREVVERHGHLTISAGIAVYPDDAAEYEALVRSADQSLYRAKQLGRNRVHAA